MSDMVTITHPDIPEKDGNTATVHADSVHVWKEAGWKVAPKAVQPKDEAPKS